MTRMTMAALPMVEDIDGASATLSATQTWRRNMESGLTHRNDIASHCITEGQIPGNSNKDVEESCNAYTGDDDRGSPEMRIVANFVQY